VHIDYFKTEADDPLYKPGEGSLVGQLGAEGGRIRAVVTWQSSNCARSVLPAWPLKVISYVGDRTGIMPRNWWLTLVIRVPDGVVRVVTRYWVIRMDAMARPGCAVR
jgi:hypothetical protein